jgi:hypothetical protein
LDYDEQSTGTNFKSRAELNHMVEWNTVQTKDMMAKMIIEEGNGGSHFKQELHRVWVQMMGLPGELWEYLTIWAIGTILGVTKDVDMKFTREYERARLQVLVLDPSLIPQSIDVVIGEFIYELHFRVERAEMTHPIPIDMEDDAMDDREEEGEGGGNSSKSMQQDQAPARDGRAKNLIGNVEAESKQPNHGKKVPYQLPSLEELQDLAHDPKSDGQEVTSAGNVPGSDVPPLNVHEELIAALTEIETPGCRSKWRAESVDESMLERAEQMKAARNLDFKGNHDQMQPSLLLLSNDEVVNNLGAVGISLGHDEASIDSSLSLFRQVELGRAMCQPKTNKVEEIFHEEEKEELENEEVDKLILNSLCSEIMDEVIDLGSAYPKDCNTTPMSKASSITKKSGSKNKHGKGKKSVQNERSILE